MAGNIGNMTRGQLRLFIRQVGKEDFFGYRFKSSLGFLLVNLVSGFFSNYMEVDDGVTVNVLDGETVTILPIDGEGISNT
jgi:hypothetical protein